VYLGGGDCLLDDCTTVKSLRRVKRRRRADIFFESVGVFQIKKWVERRYRFFASMTNEINRYCRTKQVF